MQQQQSNSSLSDPGSPVWRDYSAAADRLLVLFGGIKLGFGMPQFEFSRVLSETPVKKLFVRDARQGWYLRGVDGVGRDVPSITQFIRTEQERAAAAHLIAVGNSMGGFAALLFGCLSGANRVVVFSAQTFIAPGLLWRVGDRRWKWKRLRAIIGGEPRYFDLRPVIQAHPQTECHVHYSSTHRLDSAHAMHLEGLPNVVLHPHAEGGHRMVKALRDSGELTTILNDAITG